LQEANQLIAEIGLLRNQLQEQASHCHWNGLLAVGQFPQSARSGKPVAAIYHRTDFHWKMQENYQP
jgi:hypothetical protein